MNVMKTMSGDYHGKGSMKTRKQRYLMVAMGSFVFCCMFWIQIRLGLVANRADLRANVVQADRSVGIITRSNIHQEGQRKRVTQEDEDTIQPSSGSQASKPIRNEVDAGSSVELQNLRAVAPLSAPGPAILSTPPRLVIADDSVIAPVESHMATTDVMSLLVDRHDVVSGYDAAMKYLANYMIPEGSDQQLFLFFVCGDERGQQTDWMSLCVDASKVVYEVFATSPSRNKLLTIHAGLKQDWSTSNAFFSDGDLKVKRIPAIMQWHGNGRRTKRATSGMIIEESLLYKPLLRYLFKNEDVLDPLLAPETIASKNVVLLKGYDSYRLYMDTIAAGENSSVTAPIGPMFLFFIAGRLASNNRPWCPYCRYSEISVEYAFYAFAPQGSRLVKVETVNSYSVWKSPANKWRYDTGLMIRGVPWMYHATFDSTTHTFSYARYKARFSHPEDLRGVFQG
ncbi:unnamed protein product [Peronospora belbahrii]|uniref:Thioredoxin domain-containing protein n=1 Tax=Peronospora belbahrii TaxID=622444 RepID=A0ABN8CJU0_9STRA|nr:unnamed protein product [Peronospora belbahrii]